MGIQQKITCEEIDETVEPVIRSMTKEIGDKIRELNGGEPVSAVFIVGGGGKLPLFSQLLADELGISRQRCALRGEEVLKEIDYQIKDPILDPMFVTPIGICLNFYDSKNNFIYVNFNGERVKLYDNGHLMVVDAVIQAGFPNEGLFPKRGRALEFTLNGTPHMIRGELGETAVVKVNDEEVSINSSIRAGDKITVKESTAGAPASAQIRKLKEYEAAITVVVNDSQVILPKYADVNGELQSGYYEIEENDNIKLLDYYTVRQIADFMDVKLKEGMNIYVNNKLSDENTLVYSNFSIIWTLEELSLSDVDREEVTDDEDDEGYSGEEGWDEDDAGDAGGYEDDSDESSDAGDDVKDAESGDDVLDAMMADTLDALKKVKEAMEPGGTDEGGNNDVTDKGIEITVKVNGSDITLKGKKDYIYVDVFEYIDFDLSKPQGRAVVTTLNGRSARFDELIKTGDEIEIYWDKK